MWFRPRKARMDVPESLETLLPAGSSDQQLMDSNTYRRLTVPVPESNRRLPAPDGVAGGVDLRYLAPGARLEITTKNTVYTVVAQGNGSFSVSGHPEHCPTPRAVRDIGSVLITGAVYDRFLAPGMRMEYRAEGRRVFTSRVVSIQGA